MPGTGFVMCMLAITVLYYSGDPEKTELQETPLPINAISTKDFKVLVSLWFLSSMSLKIPRKIKQSPPSYLWYRHNGLLFLCFPNHFSFRRWHDFVVKSSSLWVLPKQFGCPSLQNILRIGRTTEYWHREEAGARIGEPKPPEGGCQYRIT